MSDVIALGWVEIGVLLTSVFGAAGFVLVQVDKVDSRAVKRDDEIKESIRQQEKDLKHYANGKDSVIDQKLDKFIRDSDKRQQDHFQAMETLRETINDLTHSVGVLTGKIDSFWTPPSRDE